jgi:hypothetical protein
MNQKPLVTKFPNVINRSNSMLIEFEFNRAFAPLMLFDFVLSSFWIILVLPFISDLSVLIGIFIVLYGLSFIQYFNSHHFIKKIIVERGKIQFKYYGFSVMQGYVETPLEVAFIIKPIGEKLKVRVLDNTFILSDIHDLPIITERIAIFLNLEFVETTRLSRNKEVLVYQRR